MAKAKMQYLGTGRRKSSVARVRLIPGTGNVTINKKSLDDFDKLEGMDGFENTEKNNF